MKIHRKLECKVGASFINSRKTATGAKTTLLSIIKTMLIYGIIIQGNPEDKHYGAAAVETPK